MRLAGSALLAALICAAASCDLALEDEVLVLLPAPPVPWQIAFPRMGFRVVTRNARAAVQGNVVDWRAPVPVTCARSVNVPVLAYPAEGHFRPAGGFYPLSLRAFQGREVLELTWEDGAAALVMQRLVAAGRDASLFNVPRLRRFLAESADPWDVDLDAVAQKIACGEFRAWDIDRLPERDADLDPGPGTWFFESPFSPLFEAVDGRVHPTGVTMGCHYLFSLDGRCWRLEVGQEETLLTAPQ